MALGVHDSFLNAAAFGAWEAGALCLDVGTETSDLLNSGTFSILIRSLSDLTHGDNVPVRLSIRPQNPPVIQLGQGTFNADGTIADPLMKVTLEDFAIELYVLIRNPAVVSNPLGADDAAAVCRRFRSNPRWRVVDYPGGLMDEIWRRAGLADAPRRSIFDTRLALTLKHHGVTDFATGNVKQFDGFGFARVWDPLARPESERAGG